MKDPVIFGNDERLDFGAMSAREQARAPLPCMCKQLRCLALVEPVRCRRRRSRQMRNLVPDFVKTLDSVGNFELSQRSVQHGWLRQI